MPSFPWRRYGIFLVLILLFAALPVISVALSSIIAETSGCALNEARAHPCMFLGVDAGELLYALFVMGWLMLFTIPAGVVLLGVWLMALIFQWLRWRTARRATQ